MAIAHDTGQSLLYMKALTLAIVDEREMKGFFHLAQTFNREKKKDLWGDPTNQISWSSIPNSVKFVK